MVQSNDQAFKQFITSMTSKLVFCLALIKCCVQSKLLALLKMVMVRNKLLHNSVQMVC